MKDHKQTHGRLLVWDGSYIRKVADAMRETGGGDYLVMARAALEAITRDDACAILAANAVNPTKSKAAKKSRKAKPAPEEVALT